jgi:hypothetical protein
MIWLCSAFLALGAYVSAVNWLCIYWSHRDKKYHSSVPLIGAFFLGLGFLGFSTTRPFWWTSIFIDYGTLIAILGLPYLLSQFWSTSRINRLHLFCSEEGGRKTTISLFKGGVGVVLVEFDPPIKPDPTAEYLTSSISRPCAWRLSGSLYELNELGEGRVVRIKPLGAQFLCEDAPTSDPVTSYFRLDGLKLTEVGETVEPTQNNPRNSVV